ncbi:MAG TPA: CpaD family pilus assembly lipoprotein [Patescibacteria group bacterium]|jgi:type IV pilus biogenesis protein CpaD/CtpE|nr:CpaD family pilus assembly lipoprotein [Patescibacteria group bacterium]
MRRTIHLMTTALALGALALPLTSCESRYKTDLGFDTFMSHEKLTLRETDYSAEFETAKLDRAGLHAVAERYAHYGEGPLLVTITYDPKSHTNSASHATTEAGRIATALRNYGVPEVKTDILPAAGKGGKSTVVVEYTGVIAQAPRDCEAMGGVAGHQTDTNLNYHIGCTTDMELAKEIARPQDLQGRTGLDTASGRRQYLLIEPYKHGVPNPPPAQQTVQ